MIGSVALIDAMSAAGWAYDEASHGFEFGDVVAGKLWVSWQQAADMLAAAEKGREVAAVEVEPVRREVAEMVRRVANER